MGKFNDYVEQARIVEHARNDMASIGVEASGRIMPPEAEEGRKIGEGHMAAMGRLGLKELRNAMNPSRESVADAEIGLYGTQTQGEIAAARGGPGYGEEQEEPSTKFEEMIRDGAHRAEQERGIDR